VENGRLALEALAQRAYPLVLMDCQMPELDGYQAARELRSREQTGRRVPLIAVTAHALVGERERAIAAGMDDYITKPLSRKRLRETLLRWWPRESLVPAARRGSSIPSGTIDEGDGALAPNVVRSQSVVRVFLEHVPGQVASIVQAAASSDFEALRQRAHKLKGSCLSVGVPRMAALCATLEAGSKDPVQLARELEHEFSEVRARLARAVEQKSA
jgi:CheY-like chemotaxis protein/HPt (histidine-containing phosphotransfer) domain-containing protein